MKKEVDEKFWLLLVPSWIVSGFFLFVFLRNLGWWVRTPRTLYELAYLVVAFVLFVLPFVSRVKLGKLLEFERTLKEAKADIDGVKGETRQILATLSALSATAMNTVNFYGTATKEQVDGKLAEEKGKTALELKILNTLWTKQVMKFPDLDTRFTFRLNGTATEFLAFREAGNRLLGEGLISETDIGQFALTVKGLEYCAEHYKEFPADTWFEYEPLDQANLKKVLEKLGK